MGPIEYEVRSGRPMQVIVQDDEGKRWMITVNMSVMGVISKNVKNPDGSPQFDINFGMNFVTTPAEPR